MQYFNTTIARRFALLAVAVSLACTSPNVNIMAESPAPKIDVDSTARSDVSAFVNVSTPIIGLNPAWSQSTFVLDMPSPDLLPDVEADLADVPYCGEAFEQVVSQGVESIPTLLEHLGDRRKTKITFATHGLAEDNRSVESVIYHPRASRLRIACSYSIVAGPFSEHRFSTNERTWRAARDVEQYTPTVGDICFIALGHIVNRDYIVVDYDSSNEWWVNSPTECAELLS